MPSLLHDALLNLLLSEAELVGELLVSAGLLAPGSDLRAQPISPDLSQLAPKSLHADGAVLLLGLRRPVVVEVQLGPKPDKQYTWPLYLAALQSQHRCEVVLLVLTLDRRTARWARRVTSQGMLAGVPTLVLGPDEIPLITDPEQARRTPNMTLLSALAHGQSEAAPSLARAASVALGVLDEHFCKVYTSLLLKALRADAREVLEDAMIDLSSYPTPEADALFARVQKRREQKIREASLAEGEARATQHQRDLFLRLLGRRFGEVPEHLRARVAQADLSQVEHWIEALVLGESLEAMFA